MLIKLSGELREISETKKLGSGRITDIILFRPAMTTSFGETIGRDQWFKIQYFEKETAPDHTDRLKQFLNRLVTVQAYINGIKHEKNGETYYHNNLTMKNIDFYQQ